MSPAPILVDRRRLVPGELRHLELGAGERELDVLGAIAGVFGRRSTAKQLRCTPVTIGIWGASAEGVAVPWADIASIVHRKVERGSSDNQVTLSQLDFVLDDAIWRGERLYEVTLDVLEDLHPRLARESQRALATSLDRAAAPRDDQRSFPALLSAAREWLASDEGRAVASRLGGDYRKAERTVPPELIHELRVALVEAPADADRGPFAAIVAAELGLTVLEEELAALTASPCALTAAVAIGAASRLGVSPIRVGKVEHVEPYIDAETSVAITSWVAGA